MSKKLSDDLFHHFAKFKKTGLGHQLETVGYYLPLEGYHKELVDRCKTLEADRDSLDKTIHNLMVVNGEALAKVTRLESRLVRVNELLSNNYPCYDKDRCKNCSGEADEIDYKSCVGYNTLTALRVEGKL